MAISFYSPTPRALLKGAAIVGTLGAGYASFPDHTQKIPFEQKYDLPQKIAVKKIEANLTHGIPVHCEEPVTSPDVIPDNNNPLSVNADSCWVNTDEIDYNNPFTLTTSRYTVIQDQDYGLSQNIGYIGSIPVKLFLWDSDVAKGLDEDRIKALLAMLEHHPEINNLTVRVNHNSVWEDFYRLFNDERLGERNHIVSRIFLGGVGTSMHELFAELFRGDYYNPYTQTAVLYSNIEAIAAHELGHHIDYQQYSSDWEYNMFSFHPGALIKKEWNATQIAHEIMGDGVQVQYHRILFPALLSYILMGMSIGRLRLNSKMVSALYPNTKEADLTFKQRAVADGLVSLSDELRVITQYGVTGLAGLATFSGFYQATDSEVFGMLGFFGGMVASNIMANLVGYAMLPFFFEDPNRWNDRPDILKF